MVNLENVIQNRRWERHNYPFPYVYAQNVFTNDFYQSLENEYKAILAKGLSEDLSAGGQFSRNMPGYDCYGMGFVPGVTGGNLSVFISPHWYNVMGNLCGVKGTGHMNAGMHHHKIGSDHGFIHNDLNPVWFPIAGEGFIRGPNYKICNYKNGSGPLAENEKVEVCRAVAMIFYLNNGPWFDGDGGETGFYSDPHSPVDQPAVRIPPYDNSLIVYECTPISYHSFIHNRVNTRSSIIMWIHRTIEDATETFGDEHFERWGINDHPLNPNNKKRKA